MSCNVCDCISMFNDFDKTLICQTLDNTFVKKILTVNMESSLNLFDSSFSSFDFFVFKTNINLHGAFN